MLDDLGLLPALIWQLDRYQEQTGIRVHFQASDLEGRRFRSELETAAYRIVQEALTNVARHAGVKQAAVTVRVEGQTLCVGVEDRGAGFDLPSMPFNRGAGGLAGMQERATLLGGRLTIELIPGSGTRVTALLPL